MQNDDEALLSISLAIRGQLVKMLITGIFPLDFAKLYILILLWHRETGLNHPGYKDQESIQSSTTLDPGYQWESDKLTARHQKREPRGQPFPSR